MVHFNSDDEFFKFLIGFFFSFGQSWSTDGVTSSNATL